MKNCPNCSQPVEDGSRFCPNCGETFQELVESSKNGNKLESVDYRGERVRLCEDGKYRWMYEMSFLTNPSIFLTVFKVFACVIIGMFLFFAIIAAINGDWKTLVGMTKACGVVLAIFLGLAILSMFFMAVIYKGKYIVLFEMDEKEIWHTQAPEQFKKAQKLGAVTAAVGGARGSFSTAGTGLLAASKQSSISEFSKVRKVKPRRWLNVIKVNQPFEHNQVYVPKEDFDFVYDFIKSRCPKAK